MRKIGITADCSSGLEYAPFEHNIRITRTTIHFGDETLVDGIDITAEGFYEKLKNRGRQAIKNVLYYYKV